jgi:ADP-ribosylglycohydrolase
MKPSEAARRLGNSVVAHQSAVTAVHAAAHFTAFAPMMDWILALGGDVDTIGAMAGGIFGARHGLAGLPPDLVERLEEGAWIDAVARRLHAAHAEVFADS